MQLAAKLPFKAAPKVLGQRPAAQDDIFTLWLEGLKRQAKENLASGESVRIAWQARFKIPRYPSFDLYTPEEALLELWEQHYYEHPDSVELSGVYKRRNAQTGYAYYATGDSLLDKIEEAFGRGETPDLSVFDGKGGRDIFREAVFVHDKKGPGFKTGQAVAPESGLQGVQERADGAKITAGGAVVSHTDFSSDEWLKKALEDDTALKAFADKIKGA